MKAISLSEYEYQWLRKKNNNENWISIRIHGNDEKINFKSRGHDKQFKDILYLYFMDIQEVIEQDGTIYRPFNEDDYKKVIEFVEKHKDADKLFVHCAMGVCRSAGIVQGLGNKYDWIETQHGIDGKNSVFPYPNVISWFS